jgi:hypothetical protein
MSEKTGNLEKLKYDFNTSSNLESFIPNLKQWIRQTSREFRSSSYKRRINGEEYFGPIYEYGTNRLVKTISNQGCIESYNYTPSKRQFGT